MRRLGVALILALAVSAPVAAYAEGDYPGPPPPQVLGEQIQAAPAVAPAAVQASGASTLPVTGGDVAELAIIGVGLVGVGTVLVRRTRRTPDAA